MKVNLSINQLITNNFLFNKVIFNSRFGCYNNYYATKLNKKYMIINLNYILVSLKKVIIVTYKLANYKGIFLNYISKSCINEYEKLFINTDDLFLINDIGYGYNRSNKFDKRNLLLAGVKKYSSYLKYYFYPNKKKENFYVLFTNGLYGFISNFNKIYLKHMLKGKKKNSHTDYSRLNLPSIVFVTKKSYNEYYNIFRIFIRKRILCIRTFSLMEEVNINIGYNLSVNDCSKVFNICKEIYNIIFLKIKKKW